MNAAFWWRDEMNDTAAHSMQYSYAIVILPVCAFFVAMRQSSTTKPPIDAFLAGCGSYVPVTLLQRLVHFLVMGQMKQQSMGHPSALVVTWVGGFLMAAIPEATENSSPSPNPNPYPKTRNQ